MKTTQLIEALLFASDAPLAADDLARAGEELNADDVRDAIEALRAAYERDGRAFQIYEIAEGFQLLTRPEYAPHVERFETVPGPTRLSSAALEVLAIVAYRQPIGRSEIEDIRGVGSAHVLRSLQDVALLEVVGRGEGLGRPLLYGTTRRFLDHFGFASLDDLPRPDELPVVLTEREPGPAAAPDEGDVGDGRAGEVVEGGVAAEGEPEDSGSDPAPNPGTTSNPTPNPTPDPGPTPNSTRDQP
jgi:segregation and condensation protein B